MAINKKLIHFKNKHTFLLEVANGNILNTSIVFIQDTLEIYTHGTFYDGKPIDLSNLATKSEVPTKLSQLENNTNYITKTEVADSYLVKGDYALKSDVEVEVEVEVPNGVYAITADGKLIDYNTADTTATGVALVAGEHKFMIAKSDATDGSNSSLYWGKNLYGKDVAGVVTNGNADGTNSAGYLPKSDGSYQSTPNLSGDFTTWTAGALAEFNGAANTAAIIAGYTEHGVSMETRDMCSVLNTFNTSDSFKDWYVPACGQLALMYLNMTEINAALDKIGGTALAAVYYWSSSEYSSNNAWSLGFGSGLVSKDLKGGGLRRVRFVRDISVKPLKERVSELESKITQLNAVLVDTKEEIDSLLGDINTILESIINPETPDESVPNTPDDSIKNIITFTVKSEMYPNLYTYTYEAEEGMTWEEFLNNSEYSIEPLHPQSFSFGTYVNCNGYDGNYIIYSSAKVAQLISYTIIDGEVYTYHDEK